MGIDLLTKDTISHLKYKYLVLSVPQTSLIITSSNLNNTNKTANHTQQSVTSDFNSSIIMKTSAAFITSALLATTALAAPEPEAWNELEEPQGWLQWGKHQPACPGDKNKGPIPYTSTYNIVATPGQVVDLGE